MSQPHAPAETALWDGFLEHGEKLPSAANRVDSNAFQGERILITGAGGYLGAAAARAMAMRSVAHLCLLDVVEHGLYDLQQQLESRQPGVPYDMVLGSVTDPALLTELMHRFRPTLVLHTAAFKHVPMLESNVLAAIATNVLGTATLLSALKGTGVRRTVLCSTDKAVQPVGIMGATKKLAEALALTAATDVRVLRLCNVLGSTGSVAPRFAEQIARREPLTVTDRAATRLWIARQEAVNCLLEAFRDDLPTPLAISRHARQRHVTELAAFMLGRSNVAAPQIAFTGLRRGERLSEALREPAEISQPNGSPLLDSLVPVRPDPQKLEAQLAALTGAVHHRDEALAREVLAREALGHVFEVNSEAPR